MNTGIISSNAKRAKSPVTPSLIVASYATVLAGTTVALKGGFILNSIALMSAGIAVLIAVTEVVTARLLKK